MITKQVSNTPLPSDPKLRAGIQAERQMAFYLHREFAIEPEIFVLNDLRLVDAHQPEHDGSPGAAQIDHLVLHRWGAVIIESKSVTDEVSGRTDGAGGDEWTRRYKGKERGMPSPIQQARRQGEFLRAGLQRHRQSLRGGKRVALGLRTITKLATGTDERGFLSMPVQIVVAVSDTGRIKRVGGWKAPSKPFQTFVNKADLVCTNVRDEIAKHRRASSLLTKDEGRYGLWSLDLEELAATAQLLADSHTPRADDQTTAPAEPNRIDSPKREPRTKRPTPSTPPPNQTPATVAPSPTPKPAAQPAPKPIPRPTCKACGSTDLGAKSGRYGYYWQCAACNANTKMPTTCSVCGHEGRGEKGVRIRKDGPAYLRACGGCGIEEKIWVVRG